ncbi:LysR family transcriptional regulator [Kocuria sp. CPCC 205268]|uniref:LysR family transcriptional regulator n=1 Tax=Kocuria oxytropis TaxID=3058913 RepID=UPI0034D7A7FB
MTQWPDPTVLELLVGIDDHGSLSAAGRHAGVSQPNASRALQLFERQLGVALVRRSPAGSTLTPEGTVIAHWARRVLDETQQLLEAAEGLRAHRQAELAVAASMTVAEHLVPEWLSRFHRAHPEVRVHLQVHNSDQVFTDVATGTCDVGFVESPSVPSPLHHLVVARDELVVVVHPTHHWAHRRRPLTISELAGTALLVREPGSGTRTTLDLALQSYDRADPLLEMGSAAAIRTSVLAGTGPAVMSTLAVAEQVKAGELSVIKVPGLELHRALRAVWTGPRRLMGPAGDLVHLAQDHHARPSIATSCPNI